MKSHFTDEFSSGKNVFQEYQTKKNVSRSIVVPLYEFEMLHQLEFHSSFVFLQNSL